MDIARHIVIVEASSTGSGLRFLEAARDNGVGVTFLTADPARYGNSGNPLQALGAEGIVVADTGSAEAIAAAVTRLQGGRRIDAVFTAYEGALERTCEAAARLGFAHTPLPVVRTARNKDLTRAALREAGIAIPQSQVVDSLPAAAAAAERIGYPCIVKPSRGMLSIGVNICSSPDDLGAAFAGALADARATQGVVLVEEHVAGPLFSAESVTFGGNTRFFGLSSRTFGPHPHFCEMSYSFPALAGTPEESECFRVVGRALAALGMAHGAAHTEFILSRRGPVIVEINARLGGFFVGAMISAVYGFDYCWELLRMALGETPEFPGRALPLGAASVALVSHTDGMLTAVGGCELARGYPGISDLVLFKGPGDKVQVPRSSTDIVGVVWGTAGTAEHALLNCSAAASAVQIEVDGARPAAS